MVVVHDANILIDLVKLELEPYFFLLDMEFHTTNLILEELTEVQQNALLPYIKEGCLAIHTCTVDDLIHIQRLATEITSLSTQDCSAWWLADTLKGILLTGDNKLRKTAKERHLPVHGHLWLFDRMVDAALLSKKQAAEWLYQLCTHVNPKLGLPKAEIDRRTRDWLP